MKKVAALILGLTLFLSFQAGQAHADTKLTGIIDNLLGVKYSYGGTTKKGFDCSGFTSYVFDEMDINLSRASTGQANEGSKVSKDELIPGDLIFFDTSGANNGEITHVGIYVGDGKFAHASTSRGVVYDKLDSKYYKPRYVTARRVMNDDAFTTYAVAN
ncbi:C40 family peptidase [Paenibacillus yanchengensis]|uniref:C40 family peptidase n=1 Tax=Paenibacillus yanchengensis TaxID=2035833 RepID=A0ABW4YN42_9BACL